MHIVLFTGGESPEPSDAEKYFEHADKIDHTVAADSGLETLDSYRNHFGGGKLSPDVIIGDMDSLRDGSLLKKFSKAKIVTCQQDKDLTDTELALAVCNSIKSSPQDIVTMIGGNGGRADHFISIYETFASDNHADIWLCGSQSIFFLREGQSIEIYGVEKSDYISAARIPGKYTGGTLESSGLEWGTNVMRKHGMPSLSNRISSDHSKNGTPIRLRANGSPFLIFAPISCRVNLIW